MATSFVRFKEHGFWVDDALLELWLYCLAAEANRLPEIPVWLMGAAKNWQLQSQGISTGAIYVGLDETLTSPSRVALVLALCQSAQATLQSHGDYMRYAYLPGFPWNPGRITTSEMSRLAVQFARLLKGEVTSTAASSEALPAAWNASLNEHHDR